MNINDEVMFLIEYRLKRGCVLFIGKNVKIKSDFNGELFRIKPENVALLNEPICIVWETWKGKNGRGGYRIERELYPQYRIPAKDISGSFHGPPRSGIVTEKAYGVLDIPSQKVVIV